MASIWGIKLDAWAVGEDTTRATMAIQSICLFTSLVFLSIRTHQMYQNREMLLQKKKRLVLQLSQWFMLLLSCFYLFTHEWNYIHLYLPTNSMDCRAWFCMVMTSIASTRVFLFIFLTLRSSFTFEGTVCELRKEISYTLIALTVIFNYGSLVFLLTDFTPISPFPNNGFCWRIIGLQAGIALQTLHGANCVLSIAAVIIFYRKAKTVKTAFMALEEDGKMSPTLIELNYEFKKHVKLGTITVAGTILMFIVADLLSVLMGITFALDQVANNFLTFIMFKESSKYYQFLLCKKNEMKNQETVIQMVHAKSTSTHDVESGNTDLQPDAENHTVQNSVVAVLH